MGGAVGIGLNKGGLTGLGILPVLLFAVVLPPRESTGFVLPLLIIGDICAVLRYRHDVLWKLFGWLLLPTLAGVVAGYVMLNFIPASIFGPLIGWLILVLIGLQLARSYFGEKLDAFFASHGFGFGMGLLVGIATMLANAAGPIATLYFISVRLAKWNLIGTSAFLFFVINLCKVPFSASLGLTNGLSVELAAMLAPFVVAGFFAGARLAATMPQRIFDRFLLGCTALGALTLIG
jgi:uncharacterized membrane protein YfcA